MYGCKKGQEEIGETEETVQCTKSCSLAYKKLCKLDFELHSLGKVAYFWTI